MTNTLLDTLKNFIDFINPEGAKSKEIQENITRSHIDAANIYCRNINELSAQFEVPPEKGTPIKTPKPLVP
ncbi:hypothetical protein PDN49_15010 [Bacillus cereus]|uniref:hypothetical protein n=1 Tax=Bacillus cereus group TaxID=86661 RepID=UPI000279A7F0|nr:MULTISPECIES: hypothetical protein [Bacillus cereus group]EJR86360.1 hypothetical protein IK7_00870 [Bacillus cereus VD156]MDA2325780.1 hypothetical protein [Bacillus cereus]MDA2332587.1 hypothetical protein [Bacillus cereus]MDA2356117.1 hypothetical protein [Bacillus cereus]